jgi:hypothetical protein
MARGRSVKVVLFGSEREVQWPDGGRTVRGEPGGSPALAQLKRRDAVAAVERQRWLGAAIHAGRLEHSGAGFNPAVANLRLEAPRQPL